MPFCKCGCGERTKGGDFCPGHDQSLRSAIEKAVGGLPNLRDLVEKETGTVIICPAKARSKDA